MIIVIAFIPSTLPAADNIYLDFGGGDSSNKYWNVFNSSYLTEPFELCDEFGNPTGITLDYSGASFSIWLDNQYPGAISKTVNWIEQADKNEASFSSASFTFGNLNPTSTYSLELVSSMDSAGGRNSYVSEFRINGDLPNELTESDPVFGAHFQGHIQGTLLTWNGLTPGTNNTIVLQAPHVFSDYNITYGIVNAMRLYEDRVEINTNANIRITSIKIELVPYYTLGDLVYLTISTVSDEEVEFSIDTASQMQPDPDWFTTGPKLSTGPTGSVNSMYLGVEVYNGAMEWAYPDIESASFFRLRKK
ncbi:MAG: hypothetical protein PHI93_05040 [Kiritimatiellae bacterium]|nr:hypothetical protein [Kiritimatiellia bacterium]